MSEISVKRTRAAANDGGYSSAKTTLGLFALRLCLASSLILAASGATAVPDSVPSANVLPQNNGGAISAQLKQARVVIIDGKETLGDATQVRPGDVIEYRVTYKNSSDKPVSQFVATMPITEGLEYVAGSTKPWGPVAKVAAADGAYGSEPLTRANPVSHRQEAVPYSEYRSLRWLLSVLPAGGVVEVSARARVAGLAPPPNAAKANLFKSGKSISNSEAGSTH